MKRLPWYQDRSSLQAAVDKHGSVDKAAEAFGTPRSTVGHWARSFGIRSGHPKTPGATTRTDPTSSPAPNGHTYLVGAEGSPLIKIGRTSGDPRARMATMQTGSPVRLYLICTLDHARWEDVLHHHFADSRRQGEWFDLSPEDVSRIRSWSTGCT